MKSRLIYHLRGLRRTSRSALRDAVFRLMQRGLMPPSLTRRVVQQAGGFISNEATIGSAVVIDNVNLRVERDAYVGARARLDGVARIHIQEGAHVGRGAVVSTLTACSHPGLDLHMPLSIAASERNLN